MTKSTLSTVLILTAGALMLVVAHGADLDPLVAESRSAVKAFGPQLKQELQAAMKAGGPVNAIAVCNVKAPMIGESVSKETDLQVARTSLKYRNADNKPDSWEQSVLERFDAGRAAGEDPANMEFFEIARTDAGEQFRYMKAIPTGEVCLACHGAELAPDVAAKLDALYPDDRARGFSIGDIRGAFTIRRDL
jgi:hypothetical protein